MSEMAKTPEPPYYAVIFTSTLSGEDLAGYEVMSDQMVELVKRQPGFLGLESGRDPGGLGFTIGYFDSLEAVRAWGRNVEHQAAQSRGREVWYRSYQLRVARVERAYGFERGG